MLQRLSLFVYILLQYITSAVNTNETVYSGPPSELPIRKIYVHNRPVYVRQMFISPQRRHVEFPPLLSRTLRIKRLGLAPVVPPVVPPSPPYVPASSGVNKWLRRRKRCLASAASYPSYFPYQAASSGSSSVAISQPFAAPSVAAPPVFAPPVPIPPFIPPQPIPPQPIPPQPIQPQIIEPEPEPTAYPLPQCYTDRSNFMCCNRTLENLMRESFVELQQARQGWSSCNIHQLATRVQQNAERMFNTTFEVISGVGDYASKSHFYSDLICKIEADGKFVLAYATTRPDAEDYDSNANANLNGKGDGQDGTEYSKPGDTALPYNSENNENAKPEDTASSYNSGNSENALSSNSGGGGESDQYSAHHHGAIHRNHVWRF